MRDWILSKIGEASLAKDDAWNKYVDADNDSEDERVADLEVSRQFGKIEAYKEMLEHLKDIQSC